MMNKTKIAKFATDDDIEWIKKYIDESLTIRDEEIKILHKIIKLLQNEIQHNEVP